MGSGWLTLPKAFGIFGLAFGLIMMTLAGINALIAIKLFSKLSKKYKGVGNYAQLVDAAMGTRYKKIINGIFALNLFGTLIAYGLVCNKFLSTVLENCFANAFG